MNSAVDIVIGTTGWFDSGCNDEGLKPCTLGEHQIGANEIDVHPQKILFDTSPNAVGISLIMAPFTLVIVPHTT